MSRSTSSAALVAAVLASSACAFEVIHGNGSVRNDERAVPGFTHVSFHANVAAEVITTGEPSVVLAADENLLGHLVVRVDDGELIIEVDDPAVALEPTAEMTVVITAATLVDLHATGSTSVKLDGWTGEELALRSSGAGSMNARGIDASLLYVESSGSGDVLVEGTTDRLSSSVSGAGDLVAADLGAGSVQAELYGDGNTTVRTDGAVNGSLFGAGDLIIHGDPSRVDVDDHGSGAVNIR